jgi:hypothetical protein
MPIELTSTTTMDIKGDVVTLVNVYTHQVTVITVKEWDVGTKYIEQQKGDKNG